MKPTPTRHKVNKSRSAKYFGGNVVRTQKVNTAPPPMRGGYRM